MVCPHSASSLSLSCLDINTSLVPTRRCSRTYLRSLLYRWVAPARPPGPGPPLTEAFHARAGGYRCRPTSSLTQQVHPQSTHPQKLHRGCPEQASTAMSSLPRGIACGENADRPDQTHNSAPRLHQSAHPVGTVRRMRRVSQHLRPVTHCTHKRVSRRLPDCIPDPGERTALAARRGRGGGRQIHEQLPQTRPRPLSWPSARCHEHSCA